MVDLYPLQTLVYHATFLQTKMDTPLKRIPAINYFNMLFPYGKRGSSPTGSGALPLRGQYRLRMVLTLPLVGFRSIYSAFSSPSRSFAPRNRANKKWTRGPFFIGAVDGARTRNLSRDRGVL